MSWYKESQSQYKNIPKKNKNGHCFTKAFDYIFNNGIIGGNSGLKLVHAIICPLMGPLAGVEFGHAWIEDGDKVIDTSRSGEIMDKESYYLMGGLVNMPTSEFVPNENQKIELTFKEDKIFRYSVEEAKKMSEKYNTYGPWEEVMSKFVLNKG